MRDEGWSLDKIAQALRLHNDTVSRYISDYLNNESFDFNYKGSQAQLDKEQTEKLVDYYNKQGILVVVNCNGDKSEIQQIVLDKLQSMSEE